MENPFEAYEALFVPALFGPWAKHVIEIAEIPSDAAVLDVACGTGILARSIAPAMSAGGSVVGLDLSEGMLAVAEEREASVEWRQGDAAALPFADATFDRVVSQFGLMLFVEPQAALREMVRVLRKDGRLAIAVWDSLERCAGYAALTALLDDVYGADVGDSLRAPFTMGAPSIVEGLLGGLELKNVRRQTRSEPAIFPGLRDWLAADVWGWLAIEHELGESDFARLLEAAHDRLGSFVQADGSVRIPMSAHIWSADRP